MAVAKTPDEKGETTFYLYLINDNTYDLEHILVQTEAVENADGSGRKTSKLRHYFERLAAGQHQKVETISPEVFGFHNRFWLSFYLDGEALDRKFHLSPFAEWELQEIEGIDLPGVEAQ